MVNAQSLFVEYANLGKRFIEGRNEREEIPERIMEEIKWIDLIMGYQEPMEKE